MQALILDTNLLLETTKMFSSIDYLNDFVLWVFLCHQFNLPGTYYIIQGALNVVMGNAPEIGDALLQSTQVLFRPILSCIASALFFVFIICQVGILVVDTII